MNEQMYQLVDRIAAGATIDDAATGLELDWDAHGNHASDSLCVPGLWQRLDTARLYELVDWFLAHGADAARLLARTLSDSQYAGAGENPIRAHLLARVPLPDLRPALVSAFCRRRLALARSLVERGADTAALADWVEADLVTPAMIDVRYQPASEEQAITFAVRMRRLQPDYPAAIPQCEYIPRLIVRLGERGLLGGGLFDAKQSSVAEDSIESVATGADSEVRLGLRVRGVAPAGLALVFRGLVGRNLHWYPVSIRLHGRVELRGDASSVSSDRARSWFRGLATDSYLAPGTVPFAVTAKPKKNTFAVVEHRDGLWRDVHILGTTLDPELLQSQTVGFDADSKSGGIAHFDSKRGTTKTEMVLKRFGEAPGDPAPLRAALLHGLSALDGITSVRWCDDAGAQQLVEAAGSAPAKPAKPAGKPKRAKPVDVEHPDRGPSRVSALRARVASLPWADAGAPRGKLADSALPPTLREWLSGGDATWPVPKRRPLEERTFAELVVEAHPELAEALTPLGDQLLAGGCIELFVPSSCADGTILFLHLPLADADGEAPVLGFDPTDEGLVGVFAPRFDHYLARVLGSDPATPTFASGPLSDPYLKALVGRLPARIRSRARPSQGVIAVGSLLEA